jgi:riboflavin kinase/FMN adenylyltransferase
VVTFEPLPLAFFNAQNAPPRLSTVYQKLGLFERQGVDQVWMMRFDAELAGLSALDFVRAVLVDGLSARTVVVGADFRFGYKREGDLAMLHRLGEGFGFEVETVSAVFAGETRISSTAIRVALAAGDLKRARTLLGRPYRMEGHVVRGEQLGRELGYPTANLRIRARPQGIQGIFAVYVREQSVPARDTRIGHWRPAVASLGWRPTVGGQEPLLEVHVFDFDNQLYGRRLEVEFVAKLRDESHFENIEQLVAQMRRDEQEARAILASMTMPDG